MTGRVSIFISFAFAASVARSAVAQSDGGEISEYLAKWQKYTDEFSHGSGTFELKASSDDGKNDATENWEVSFALSPAGKRFVSTTMSGPKGKPAQEAVCINSKYAFEVTRGSGGWQLNRVTMLADKQSGPVTDKIATMMSRVFALNTLNGLNLTELGQNLAVVPGRSGTLESLSLVKPVSVTTSGNKQQLKTATLNLELGRYASLKSATAEVVMNKTPGVVRVDNEFRSADGVPIPVRSVTRETYSVPGGDLMIINDITYDIDPAAHPDDSEFTLTAFGLPEPVGVEWRKPTPIYVWLLVAAAILAVAAVAFRALSRRPVARTGSANRE